MNQQIRPAVKALIRKGDKFLVVKHILSDGSIWWEIPGGKVEYGESPYDALHREIKEELNLDIKLIRPLGMWWFFKTIDADGMEMVCNTYLAEPLHHNVDISANPAKENIVEYRWVTVSEFLTDDYPGEGTLKDLIRTSDLS